MPRSIWKGAISFGLVSIPVAMYSATENRSPSFKQLRKGDHSPIRYKRVAESDGEEVAWEDIVRGFEFEKGRYVVFTEEELEAASAGNSKLVDVIQFVDESDIDPIMYQKSYYLAPDKTGLKAYRIFQQAIEEKGVVAIAKVAIRDKQHLATLRVKDGVLVMETMFWPDEVRAAEFEELEGDVEVRAEEVAMAESLIENLTRPFEASEFVDTSREAIEEAAARKVAGEEIVAPEEAEPTKVVDLLDALKASVEATKSAQKSA